MSRVRKNARRKGEQRVSFVASEVVANVMLKFFIYNFVFLFWPSLTSIVMSHFQPFTEVLRKNRREVTRKVWEFLNDPPSQKLPRDRPRIPRISRIENGNQLFRAPANHA